MLNDTRNKKVYISTWSCPRYFQSLPWQKLKLTFVLLVALSSAGCALGLIDKYLGEKKASHAEDQSVESSESDAKGVH